MNKISIITINRNDADGLQKTIESVVGQTYRSYEYIVIDGASTDGSVDVIKKFSRNLSYWISEADTGVFNAMNKGIKQASGDYCYFLNSGDVLVSDTVLNDVFGTKEYTAPFINGHQINDFGTHDQRASCHNRPLTLFDFYKGTIKHQATFIRRDLFDKYGLYDENLKIISDWKFFFEVIGLHNEQPEFVDIDIVRFRWNGMSTNPECKAKHQGEREAVLAELIPQSVQSDYECLQELDNYAYIVEAMKKNSLLNLIIRGLVRIFK
jgi:glycosyltransferase involved in cell wall biosynthesis